MSNYIVVTVQYDGGRESTVNLSVKGDSLIIPATYRGHHIESFSLPSDFSGKIVVQADAVARNQEVSEDTVSLTLRSADLESVLKVLQDARKKCMEDGFSARISQVIGILERGVD